ncbi:hypothetical protein AB0F81_17270 [Actinoplanes sp. NPDC024001]|uniref:hypothetical protein n=1 Tax=Actinoplanes sp. NPDC024001 TaxID=3154598 RepID=UPI0033E652A3
MMRRTLSLLLITMALALGTATGPAQAAPVAARAAVECSAINLNANVSNLGVGYAFSGKCSTPRFLVIRVQWVGVFGQVLADTSAAFPPRTAGTWSTYSGNLSRPWSTDQTSHACIWVTQDVHQFYGGPLLTSGCFLRNS